MPMLCCSPDFTNPDPDARKRAVEREAEMIRVTRRLGGPGAVCRVLSGQRYPGRRAASRGWSGWSRCIEQVLPVAREYDVVLGLENHYKDGFWKYPEFAQKQDVFLELLNAIPDREHFGVQYDPSNAIVAGDDPIDAAAGRGRPRREHARQRPLPGRGHDAGRAAPGRRHARLLAEPAARRDRQGPERLRRDLPHPGRRTATAAGSASRTA